jgi:hypothetical protein
VNRRFDRQSAIKAGLGSIAIAFLLLLGGGYLGYLVPGSFGPVLVGVGVFGVAGFLFLISSIFLPARRRGKPTFTEELLGKESLHYGTFTQGNWKAVLDDEKKREAERRKRSS